MRFLLLIFLSVACVTQEEEVVYEENPIDDGTYSLFDEEGTGDDLFYSEPPKAKVKPKSKSLPKKKPVAKKPIKKVLKPKTK